jgi:hypothetical protein
MKYYQYSSGLNLPPAFNSGEIYHFWMDTSYVVAPSSSFSI